MSKSLSPPPLKTPFALGREREFLYLKEVDILIAATQNTRAGTRNAALAMLLLCQALQPVEVGWLRWCDVDYYFAKPCNPLKSAGCAGVMLTLIRTQDK